MNELEKLRTEAYKKKKNAKKMGFLILFIEISLYILLIVTIRIKDIRILITFIFFVFLILTIESVSDSIKEGGTEALNKLTKLYKKDIVNKTINELFTNVSYKPDEGIKYDDVNQSDMIALQQFAYNFYSSDYVCGQYKTIKFEMSDINIEERKESDSYFDVFLGQWYIFDFNKNFKSDVQVFSKKMRGGKQFDFFRPYDKKYKECKLEDVEFNNKFKIFAENEVDAFYILTPNMMSKIKEFSSKIEGEIIFRFTENKLHIGIDNNKNIFEFEDIENEIDVNNEINKIKNQLQYIRDFIDELNLDNDLFI